LISRLVCVDSGVAFMSASTSAGPLLLGQKQRGPGDRGLAQRVHDLAVHPLRQHAVPASARLLPFVLLYQQTASVAAITVVPAMRPTA
jgi:hypothetical protein